MGGSDMFRDVASAGWAVEVQITRVPVSAGCIRHWIPSNLKWDRAGTCKFYSMDDLLLTGRTFGLIFPPCNYLVAGNLYDISLLEHDRLLNSSYLQSSDDFYKCSQTLLRTKGHYLTKRHSQVS